MLYEVITFAADPVRIVFRLEVPLDDGDAQAAVQCLDGCLQQRGLAGARRGHQVHGEYAGIPYRVRYLGHYLGSYNFV